jgi:hypothetical protein
LLALIRDFRKTIDVYTIALSQTNIHSQLLAENNYSGKAYIATNAEEKHYHHHAEIVAALYGRGEKFEDHAVVTELFFCASANSSKLPKNNYPCADLYFDRVFRKVQPRLVICVWKTTLTYTTSS